MAEATSALFWEHRQELIELDFAKYSELHNILRGNNNVEVKINSNEE